MISLGLVYLDEAGYTEKEAGTIDLNVKARGRTHLQTKIGGQLAKYLVEGDTQLYGFVKLAYTYRKGLGNANAVTSSFIGQPSSFTVFAKTQPQNMALTSLLLYILKIKREKLESFGLHLGFIF